jgi:hypothetical protein
MAETFTYDMWHSGKKWLFRRSHACHFTKSDVVISPKKTEKGPYRYKIKPIIFLGYKIRIITVFLGRKKDLCYLNIYMNCVPCCAPSFQESIILVSNCTGRNYVLLLFWIAPWFYCTLKVYIFTTGYSCSIPTNYNLIACVVLLRDWCFCVSTAQKYKVFLENHVFIHCFSEQENIY